MDLPLKGTNSYPAKPGYKNKSTIIILTPKQAKLHNQYLIQDLITQDENNFG